ncbi:MAG: cation transporter [Clostridia bacterium]|nr:cation transporter [Clostridia bacterium]
MEERFKMTKKAGIYGILGNIFLLILKAFVGFVSKSQAMIADSINSAGDIFASIMTFIGNKIASVPGDDTHNFGHGKAEYIFSLFIAISMMFVSIKTLLDAVATLFTGNQIIFSWWLVIVCIITIIIKAILFFYTKNMYKKYNNILLEASMADHRNDCIITTFTLISVLLSLKGITWFDSIVGIGISAWIFKTGIEIFIESYNILMDVSIDEKTKDIILDLVHAYKEIKGINELSSTPVGYQYIIFLTIAVDGNMTTFDSHKLADDLEQTIIKLDKIYKAIVHVEPYFGD